MQLEQSSRYQQRRVLQIVGAHREEVWLAARCAGHLPLTCEEVVEIVPTTPLAGKRRPAFGADRECRFFTMPAQVT